MLAISIRQPWAWLIVNGYKDIENRSWCPPEKVIDQSVLIHAGKAKPTKEDLTFLWKMMKELDQTDVYFEMLKLRRALRRHRRASDNHRMFSLRRDRSHAHNAVLRQSLGLRTVLLESGKSERFCRFRNTKAD